MNDATISVRNLSRNYGKVRALSDISFDVTGGELFGIIGPDGAGKTTLFRILATLLLPGTGSAFLDGFDTVRDYRAVRDRVGYMPGRFSLYQDLTVEENLAFFATVFGTTIEENYRLIADIYRQIEPFKKRRAGALSGGMKQKLALSCALIHRPRVLLLDEPTTGVDPVSRSEFWNMLADLKAEGITMLVSTPYMDEAGRCDRIALIQNGSFLTIDTPSGIRASFDLPLYAVRSNSMFRLLHDVRSFPGVESCYTFGEVHHAVFSDSNVDPSSLTAYLREKGHSDVDVHRIDADIEDCFMRFSTRDVSRGRRGGMQ
ncbi:MAG: ABC transporter ATP-binding protein [Treponema sp.]|jgi:ABC-type multidrug transport system ATPase subunit|nr:ABC transporter ATP-binding protein [Treponema sp.]